MQHRTFVIAVAAIVTGAASAAALVFWPTPPPGRDPDLWPVETLAADAAVALPHVLHVAPAGCPGFSISSPVPEYSRNVPGSDSYAIKLDSSHFTLAVCLGPVEETGGARGTVAETIGHHEVDGGGFWNRNPTVVSSPYGELARVDRAFAATDAPRLTDWMVDHGGYTYAFGYLHPTGDAGRHRDVEAMIASVTWDE
ncbi:hypothetical protein [Cellulomonas sp. NS3]|uniref:hypothetical protein n=1 Tax=Cellulomonas sp. NS3 TaxID=2973977 RepID=UPI0021635A2B|nr:hypothetical protein [Cellulomonas sp. NS3]